MVQICFEITPPIWLFYAHVLQEKLENQYTYIHSQADDSISMKLSETLFRFFKIFKLIF